MGTLKREVLPPHERLTRDNLLAIEEQRHERRARAMRATLTIVVGSIATCSIAQLLAEALLGA